MQIGILGPLMVRHNRNDGVPTARKPRQLLSLLLMNNGDLVPTTHLMDEIWGAEAPPSAATTLQTYIVLLRKLLAETVDLPTSVVAKEVLQTRNRGYVIDLRHADYFDLHAYRGFERAGLTAFRQQEHEEALHNFERALALWRGSALADVEHGKQLRVKVTGLEQSRLTIIECRLEAALKLGRHREVLGELAELVLRHPYNENVHAQYMVALHRSGYRTRALEVYCALRDAMVDDLGVEPGTRLRGLHTAVLSADPQLDETTEQRWSSTAERERSAIS